MTLISYYFSYPHFTGSSTRRLLDVFFENQKYFDKPTKKDLQIIYRSKEDFSKVFNAAINEITQLSNKDISPYSKPAQTFFESIWVGLIYRRINLGKEINIEALPNYIAKWKDKIGEEKFSELFQARRTSSVVSAYDRIKAGIEYFAGDF